VELSPRFLTLVLPAARSGMTARRRGVPPNVLLRSSRPISAGQLDLELIDLIPLRIGALSFRNRQQRLQASGRGNRLRVIRFIHGRIISFLGGGLLNAAMRALAR